METNGLIACKLMRASTGPPGNVGPYTGICLTGLACMCAVRSERGRFLKATVNTAILCVSLHWIRLNTDAVPSVASWLEGSLPGADHQLDHWLDNQLNCLSLSSS